MRTGQILQNMMQGLAQRASRNRSWHMQQQEPSKEYEPDNGPLTNSQIEQLKNSVRIKYA
jgi:hypothetical protein